MSSNGVLVTVYSIENFCELDRYYDEVDSLIAHVKTSRLAEGFSEILAPGEPEFHSARRRQAEGITVDENTWAQICEEARWLGLSPEDWPVAAS